MVLANGRQGHEAEDRRRERLGCLFCPFLPYPLLFVPECRPFSMNPGSASSSKHTPLPCPFGPPGDRASSLVLVPGSYIFVLVPLALLTRTCERPLHETVLSGAPSWCPLIPAETLPGTVTVTVAMLPCSQSQNLTPSPLRPPPQGPW